MDIKIKYNMMDRVNIKPLNIKGRVIGVMVTVDGTEIKCKYYSENSPKYEWFYEDELALEENKSVGFISEERQ